MTTYNNFYRFSEPTYEDDLSLVIGRGVCMTKSEMLTYCDMFMELKTDKDIISQIYEKFKDIQLKVYYHADKFYIFTNYSYRHTTLQAKIDRTISKTGYTDIDLLLPDIQKLTRITQMLPYDLSDIYNVEDEKAIEYRKKEAELYQSSNYCYREYIQLISFIYRSIKLELSDSDKEQKRAPGAGPIRIVI